MKNLSSHAQPFGKCRSAHGLDHELLDVDRVVRVLPTVHDVHHRHRQRPRIHAAHVAIERYLHLVRRRLRQRQRHAQNRVGPQPRLVRCPVQIDHQRVELHLVGAIHAPDRVENLALRIGAGLQHALAAIPPLVAVAQLHRLMRAGAGAGRDNRAARGAGLECDLDFDRRVAAAVQHFAGDDVGNGAHSGRSPGSMVASSSCRGM